VRPFFSFYGGKWRDAPKYPKPLYTRIFEPFAGSAGYSVRNYQHDVVLIDKDPDVCAVWRYLISVDPARILALPDISEGSVDDLDISSSERKLIGFWLNRGCATPRKSPSKWMRDGIRPGSFWGQRVRETIAQQVVRIKHWTVIEGDYTECSDDGATWFVDPPYQLAGKHYRHGSSDIDYDHLARWCLDRPGQIIVCESQDARWLPFRALHSAKRTKPGGRSLEAVWTK